MKGLGAKEAEKEREREREKEKGVKKSFKRCDALRTY